jgi:hypothetical protein
VRRLQRYESSLHDHDRRAECNDGDYGAEFNGDHPHSDNDDHGAKVSSGSDSPPGGHGAVGIRSRAPPRGDQYSPSGEMTHCMPFRDATTKDVATRRASGEH